MKRTVRLGKGEYGDVFCSIEIDKGRLSICGVEGPRGGGNCKGSCGQIGNAIVLTKYAPGWDAEKVARFKEVWKRWHLNNMRAGTPAQEEALRGLAFPGYPKDYFTWAQEVLRERGLEPDKGYKYGSAWLEEELPREIIEYLEELPESDKVPAWV